MSALPATPALDHAAIREDFPALDQRVHGGKPLVYLDNAASSQVCRAAMEAVSHYQRHDRANVHRGVHVLGQRATAAMEAGRESARRFLNAAHTDEIVFVRGTTEALNLVAGTLGTSIGPNDEIVLSAMEHHSNIVPWQLLAERTGARIRVAPVDEAGVLDVDALMALMGPRTRLVTLVHVSNTLGTVNPVERVIAAAHDRGIPVLLDGAQAAPHLPVDVQALDCDFYCFSGHKVFGPNGIGVLYGKRERLMALPPWQGGGDMIDTVTFDGTTFAPPPARFEAGTPNVSGIIGLGAALEYAMGVGMDRIAAAEAELVRLADQALSEIPGLRRIGTAPGKAAVCSFVLDGIPDADVGTLLDMQGIAVRTGHHCTQPLLQQYGLAGTVRASFAFYNTPDEVEALVRGLHKVRKMFGG